MTNETIARNYAATVFDLAQRHEGLGAFEEGLNTVVGLLDASPAFKTFLETPRIADGEKKALLKKVFGPVLPRALLNFLQVIIDKRRQKLLGVIGEEFRHLLDAHFGRTHVTVTVAREVSDAALGEISRRLSALIGKEAIPHIRVNPAVLGGVHLKTGDTVYDGTLRRRMKQLRKQLLTTELPPVALFSDD